MIKKYIFAGLAFIFLMTSSCSTPYSAMKNLNEMNELQYKHAVKYVNLPESGYKIAYTDEGKGDKTIIFIHGLGSYLQAWIKNVARCMG